MPEMEIILQPNNWTCNPSAYAMCMGVSLDKVIETLGHDGSRIINVDAIRVTEVVECFDGHELVLAAYKLGFAALEFPVMLGSVIPNCDLNPHWPQMSRLWDEFPADQRFVVVIASYKYKGHFHCVAWQRDKSYYLDPHCGKIDLPFNGPVKCAIAIIRMPDVK